jgi:glutathione S-transferase
MSLTLYFHPLSSYCHKVLIALYEHGVSFTPLIVNLGDPASREAFLKVWPIGKFPVLRDDARGETVPESSIIIEYLQQHYAGAHTLIPGDSDKARQCRMLDRYFDLHVHTHMQRIIGERLRPADKKDPFGLEHAKAAMATGLAHADNEVAGKTWAMGNDFTLADCAAAPALFYADKISPLADKYKNLAAYLARLTQRPSYARALKEAEPYFHMFPKE